MTRTPNPPLIAIIGAGPAGLMAAEILCHAGMQVDLYDSMPSVGRKFLMAGKGGMNITHSEPLKKFITRYGAAQSRLEPWINNFSPDMLRAWINDLGIDTFIGSSGRVFPDEMKAAPLLRSWLQRLKNHGLRVHTRHQWLGWVDDSTRRLRFLTPNGEKIVAADLTILTLGGASWPKLGSTGAWVDILQAQGITVNKLQPSNCGFKCQWSPHLQQHVAGHPLKAVTITFSNQSKQILQKRGECIITADGVEGGFIYALSAPIRDVIHQKGSATIYLDLTPDTSLDNLIKRLTSGNNKQSLSNRLRKYLHLDSIKISLLREILPASTMQNTLQLCQSIKALPVKLTATQPIEEAISSAGGVAFTELNEHLMLHKLPGVFCAGEMLDWEAPTGGYLLTGCFATGRAAGLGAEYWLKTLND